MRITDLLKPEGIRLGVRADGKSAAIDLLVSLQDQSGNLTDPAQYKSDILAREEQSTTAIGSGIAVPHAKSTAVSRPGLAAITVPDGVDYGAPDGQPSNLLFMIAAPKEGGDVHLEMLSRLMVLLMDDDFRASLLAAGSPAEFLSAIDAAEAEKYPDEVPPAPVSIPCSEAPNLPRVGDLLQLDGIRLDAQVSGQEEAIDALVSLQDKVGALTDRAQYRADILAREEQSTTAVGSGIAVPHAKSAAVKRPSLVAMTVPAGVDYGAAEGGPVKLLFMIAAPEGDSELHLRILSRLMVLLMGERFRAALLAAKTPEAFRAALCEAEAEKYPDDRPMIVPQQAAPAAPAPQPTAGPDSAAPAAGSSRLILAVTACPTGIAHTYMAAEALEKTGREMGLTLKAETNGSGGAKNVLTPEEIAACEGIIVAADKNVEMARFDGKPVLRVPVSDGINKPRELIEKILDGKAPVYHAEAGSAPTGDTGSQEGLGHRAYKHLMNGVSHMLPFVIGGGILMALSFLLDSGAAGTAAFGSSWMLPAFFNKVGNIAFGFMVPILAGYIAQSIADRPGLMVGFVGGSMAATGATFQYFVDPTYPIIPAGFLGGLLAGFVGGWFMKVLRRGCDRLPKSLEGIKPVLIYPVIGLLFIGLVMSVVNPVMGVINSAISDALTAMSSNPALSVVLGALVAGMMAIDMGGPFNKASYVFGTATIALAADGFSPVMAAVMIGGMVPPIAIALACTFFQNRFTPDERKNGVVNYIMGLCFITEGAIPFAASDPLRVIPSCIMGSAVAGALSMLFGCASPAPHGGIFVFPVLRNPLMYLVALAIGSVVGMLMLALLKKKKS